MTRLRVAWGLLAAVVLVGSAIRTVPVSAAQNREIADLLERYSRGDFSGAVEAGAARRDLDRWKTSFIETARAWIADRPSDTERRRLVAAGLVLEVLHRRQERDFKVWESMRDVVEWTCEELSRSAVPTPGELAWFRASLAVAGRTQDHVWTAGLPLPRGRLLATAGHVMQNVQANPSFAPKPVHHLAHAKARFPNEADWRVIEAIARAEPADTDIINCCAGRMGSLDGRLDGGFRPEPSDTDAAVAYFVPFLNDVEWAGFARVRVSHLYWIGGRPQLALEHARMGVQQAKLAEVRYQAHMMVGLASERLAAVDEARQAYRAALQVFPNGQSASLAGAAVRDDTSDEMLAASLRAPAAGDDPFRLYYYGTYIFWPQYIAQLHEALR